MGATVVVIPPEVAAPLTATRSASTAIEQLAPVAGSRRDVDVEVFRSMMAGRDPLAIT
ncbi:hypothetical protein BH23ACT3_BH23ACT3_19510 [soil metagenome]